MSCVGLVAAWYGSAHLAAESRAGVPVPDAQHVRRGVCQWAEAWLWILSLCQRRLLQRLLEKQHETRQGGLLLNSLDHWLDFVAGRLHYLCVDSWTTARSTQYRSV